MPQLSEAQARAIADQFSLAAQAVSDFRFQNRASLSDDELLALKSLEQKLENQSDDFTAQAIQLTLDNLEQSVAHLVEVTNRAHEAIRTLNDVRRVVAVAGNLAALGQAITTGNVEGILKAAESINALISK